MRDGGGDVNAREPLHIPSSREPPSPWLYNEQIVEALLLKVFLVPLQTIQPTLSSK